MLHGFISDSTTYDSHVAYFSQHVNVLTIDLPDMVKILQTCKILGISRILLMHLMRYCRNLTRMTCTYSAILGGRVALYYALYGSVALRGLLLEYFSGDSR